MQKRRKGDTRFIQWFLLKFVLPIILTFVGTGAVGNYFVNAEIQRGWDRWDDVMNPPKDKSPIATKASFLFTDKQGCKHDHALSK